MMTKRVFDIENEKDYADMLGCVGWFWDEHERTKTLGIFTDYATEMECCFIKNNQVAYSHFCPAKKSELKFYEEKE